VSAGAGRHDIDRIGFGKQDIYILGWGVDVGVGVGRDCALGWN
jgi:hypothetical protein